MDNIGVLAAVYPATWGVLQLYTGAFSDRVGRKWMIVSGMCVQSLGILLIAGTNHYWSWVVSLILLGLGTAQVYPTLLAAIGDVAEPRWRASAVGVYRLWRDLGYAVGAILSGVVADLFSIRSSIVLVGLLTLCSGVIAAKFMRETLYSKRGI